MSSKHSAEFKAKVALEAVSENNKIVAELAKKYEISEDEVSSWASALTKNAATIFSSSTASGDHEHSTTSTIIDVNIDSDDEIFIAAVAHGVEEENLDYNKLFLWSGLGIATVIVFVVALIFFSQYSFSNAQKNALESSSYSEITKLKTDQNEVLNSYGVVDLEDGVYHIPIDKAIEKIAVD